MLCPACYVTYLYRELQVRGSVITQSMELIGHVNFWEYRVSTIAHFCRRYSCDHYKTMNDLGQGHYRSIGKFHEDMSTFWMETEIINFYGHRNFRDCPKFTTIVPKNVMIYFYIQGKNGTFENC